MTTQTETTQTKTTQTTTSSVTTMTTTTEPVTVATPPRTASGVARPTGPAEMPGARLRRALTGVRARVVVGYLLLPASALGTSTVIVNQLLHNRLDREIEMELAQETEELRA